MTAGRICIGGELVKTRRLPAGKMTRAGKKIRSEQDQDIGSPCIGGVGGSTDVFVGAFSRSSPLPLAFAFQT